MNARDIRNIRIANGIQQKELAELAGVPVGTWSNVETGRQPLYEDMKAKVLQVLRDLGCDFSILQKKIDFPIHTKAVDRYGNRVVQPNVEEKQEEAVEVQAPMHIKQEFLEQAMIIAEILTRKNQDYGDSFFQVYEEFGNLSTYIRLKDKMGRLKSMVEGQEMLVQESLEDVYKDIAGYCILTLNAINKLKGKGE